MVKCVQWITTNPIHNLADCKASPNQDKYQFDVGRYDNVFEQSPTHHPQLSTEANHLSCRNCETSPEEWSVTPFRLCLYLILVSMIPSANVDSVFTQEGRWLESVYIFCAWESRQRPYKHRKGESSFFTPQQSPNMRDDKDLHLYEPADCYLFSQIYNSHLMLHAVTR